MCPGALGKEMQIYHNCVILLTCIMMFCCFFLISRHEQNEAIHRVESFWRMHSYWRADGHRNFPDSYLVYLYFISHHGFAPDNLFYSCLLDEYQKIYSFCQEKSHKIFVKTVLRYHRPCSQKKCDPYLTFYLP
jgi:hypothetical protein